MQVRVHQDRGVEEDGEGQVEVEREEPRGSWHIIRETGKTTNGALLCSLVQIARIVIVRVIVDGVLGVMIVVLIGHDEVRVNVV